MPNPSTPTPLAALAAPLPLGPRRMGDGMRMGDGSHVGDVTTPNGTLRSDGAGSWGLAPEAPGTSSPTAPSPTARSAR